MSMDSQGTTEELPSAADPIGLLRADVKTMLEAVEKLVTSKATKDKNEQIRLAQLEAYKQGVSLHNAQETLFWTRNNIMVVTQGALVAAFATLAKDASSRGMMFVLAALGVTISGFWALMNRRSRFVLDASLHTLAAAELALGLVGDAAVFFNLALRYDTVRITADEWEAYFARYPRLSGRPSVESWSRGERAREFAALLVGTSPDRTAPHAGFPGDDQSNLSPARIVKRAGRLAAHSSWPVWQSWGTTVFRLTSLWIWVAASFALAWGCMVAAFLVQAPVKVDKEEVLPAEVRGVQQRPNVSLTVELNDTTRETGRGHVSETPR